MTAAPNRSLPRLAVAAPIAFLVALFVTLGLWQLGRAAWKSGLLAAIAAAERAPPVPLATALAAAFTDRDGDVPLRTIAIGRFAPSRSIRVGADLRAWNGRLEPGSDVVQLLLRVGAPPLAVDRGWAPTAAGTVLAEGPATVVGVLRRTRFPPAAAPAPAAAWLPSPDPAAINAALGHPDLPPVLLVALGHSDGLPIPPAALDRPPDDHLGYALTWFGLAGCVVALYWKSSRRVCPALPFPQSETCPTETTTSTCFACSTPSCATAASRPPGARSASPHPPSATP